MRIIKLLSKKASASYVVEASFIFPIIILVLTLLLSATINLYQDVDKTAAKMAEATDMNFEKIFLAEAEIEKIGSNAINKILPK